MPGLNLGTFGGTSARPQATTAPQPATSVTSAAFGPGYSVAAPSTSSALAPNDAFGISFWIGVLAIGGLVYLRSTLPR
jgi:hypothetical protein